MRQSDLAAIQHPSAWRSADMARPSDWQATLPGPALDELLAEAERIDTTDNAAISSNTRSTACATPRR